MKKIVLMISLLAASFHMMGQGGFRFGLGTTYMTVGESPYESSKALFRPEIGFVFNNDVSSDRFSFSTEVSLAFKGMNFSHYQRIVNDSSLAYIFEQNYKVRLTYLEWPLMMKREVKGCIVEFGGTLGLRLGAKRIGTSKITMDYSSTIDQVSEYSETSRYSNREVFPAGVGAARPLNDFDVGVNLGAAYDLGGMTIGMRYYYGLLDIIKNNYPISNYGLISQNNKTLKAYIIIPFD